MTRFGPGVVLIAALAAIETLLVRPTSRDGIRNWLRALWPIGAAAATGELILALTAFALLPFEIARDLLWPGISSRFSPNTCTVGQMCRAGVSTSRNTPTPPPAWCLPPPESSL